MQSKEKSTGIYLFCLAYADPAQRLRDSGAGGDHFLNITAWQDIAAVWSPVDLEEFCGPEAAARLHDLVWIAPRATAHERVVAAVMRRTPVLPVRFGTIFSSEAKLRQVLGEHCEMIREFLARVTDQGEWAVKVLLDRTRAREELLSAKLAQEANRLAGLSPGRRYFQEQLLRSRLTRELGPCLLEACQEMQAGLRRLASDFCQRRVISQAGSGNGRDLLFNWAFLVPNEAVAAFQAQLAAVNARGASQGLSLEGSGPWPPYSFCPSLTPEPPP